MNRYKIRKADYPAAKKYLAGESFKKDSPRWAVKFKESLEFRGGKLFYNELEVVPEEEVDNYLRKQVFDKKSDLPLSRDGGYHLLKKRVAGITRSRLMKFLKAQSVVQSTANANPKPKQTGGAKAKQYHFQCDLIFVRKPDLTKISRRFVKTVKTFESYIVSVTEKITGLVRLGYTTTKNQNTVTPIVIRLIKSICEQLGIDPKKYKGSSDSGGEFNKAKLSEATGGWEFVKLAQSIEKKNQTIQSRMFQLARARRAYKVENLLKQVETIENQNYNRVMGRTPNEAAEQGKQEEKENVAKYNKARKIHVVANKTQFKVGDLVRIQLLIGKDKGGVGFKSYKGETWSKRVYKITHATKNSKPPKFRVNKRWYTGDHLSRSEEIDQKSEKKIEDAEEQLKKLEKLEYKQRILKFYADKAKKKKKRGRPSMREARDARAERRRLRNPSP